MSAYYVNLTLRNLTGNNIIRQEIRLITFSRYQSVEINPLVSFRMLIFKGLPMLVEYTLKGLVLK